MTSCSSQGISLLSLWLGVVLTYNFDENYTNIMTSNKKEYRMKMSQMQKKYKFKRFEFFFFEAQKNENLWKSGSLGEFFCHLIVILNWEFFFGEKRF